MDQPIPPMESQMTLDIIGIIYKDYKAAVDTLMESIDLLVQEVAILQANALCPATPTPIPFPLTSTKVPTKESRPDTQTSHPAPPPQAIAPKSTWAIVARKGRKQNPTQTGMAQNRPTAPTKPQPSKRAITARSRCLIIKREGSPLAKTGLELRDEINHAVTTLQGRGGLS